MKRGDSFIQSEKIIYSSNDEPIIISKTTTDILLKSTHPGDAMALYWFYYQTAKWQKTNQPKAADNYCMKGLNWGYEKFQRAQKILIENKLIKRVRITNNLGRVTGWFIHVNFIWNSILPELLKPDSGKPIENITRTIKIQNWKTKDKYSITNNNKISKKEILLQSLNIDQNFLEIFKTWLTYKKNKKQSYKDENSIRLCYNKLLKFSNNNPELAKEIIEDAMSKNYSGFFQLNEKKYNNDNIKPHYKAQKILHKGEWKWAIKEDGEIYFYKKENGNFYTNSGRKYQE